MSRKRFDSMCCPVARSLDQIGDWWSLLIVRDAMFGIRRYVDFQSRLGISKNILSDRLNQLVEDEVLEKVDVGTHGERYEYRLTEKGRDLFTVLVALRQWGDRWIYGKGNEPFVLKDRAGRSPVAQVQVRDADGKPLSLNDVFIERARTQQDAAA